MIEPEAEKAMSSVPLTACEGDRSRTIGNEPHRPQFHFTPARNWMNDPNGLVYFDGEYHLFYQYNPRAIEWGHLGWGHAVSRDMVQWERLPPALAEEDGVMIYSGSAVVDWENTSGLGGRGRPPLVAVYTGHHTERSLQDQRIAYSTDRGRTWTQFAGNPVLDIGAADFRDPKVFWHAPTHSWIMVVSLPVQRKISFYGSKNLKSWTHLSDFGPAGATVGIWECPDLFPLPIDQDPVQTQWVLLVNLNPGGPAGGSGCQYFVGDFDGERFVPEHGRRSGEGGDPLWLDFGPDCYAAASWSDVPSQDGRRIIIAWMSNWLYAGQVPTYPWRGAMTVPRSLALRRTDGGVRLVQHPVNELEQLRTPPLQCKSGSFAEAAAWLARQEGLPQQLDVEAVFEDIPEGAVFCLTLNADEGESTSVICDTVRGRVSVDRSRSGVAHSVPGFASRHGAPVEVSDGALRLRMLFDVSSVEVFAQDGMTALTCLMLPVGGARRMRIEAVDGEMPHSTHISIFPLRSACLGGVPAP